MLIQHEATGQIFEVSNGSRVPGGFKQVPEAKRVETIKRADWCETMGRPKAQCRCPDCGPCLVDIGSEG